jgi:hypothetical protein
VNSTKIKNDDGQIVGTVIVVIACRESPKAPDLQHLLLIRNWFIPHDAPVADKAEALFKQLEARVSY